MAGVIPVPNMGWKPTPLSGCLTGVVLFLFLCIVLSLLITRWHTPYYQARRELGRGNHCEAARVFAEIVRADNQDSWDAVKSLTAINHPCAVREMIDLLDHPKGEWVPAIYRKFLYEGILRQLPDASAAPGYDPEAPLEIRRQQKAALMQWFREHSPEEGKGQGASTQNAAETL